jgi:hypothetical protein
VTAPGTDAGREGNAIRCRGRSPHTTRPDGVLFRWRDAPSSLTLGDRVLGIGADPHPPRCVKTRIDPGTDAVGDTRSGYRGRRRGTCQLLLFPSRVSMSPPPRVSSTSRESAPMFPRSGRAERPLPSAMVGNERGTASRALLTAPIYFHAAAVRLWSANQILGPVQWCRSTLRSIRCTAESSFGRTLCRRCLACWADPRGCRYEVPGGVLT